MLACPGNRTRLEWTHFSAKLVIGRNDCHFDNSDDKHCRDRAQESEDIVIAALILPQISEDKEQFDEEDGKWDQSCEQGTCRAAQVPRLEWNLPRNGVGLQRMIPWIGPHVSKPAAKVHEGNLDEQPKREQSDQGTEWNCRARCLCPDEQVQDQDEAEAQAREKQGSLNPS